MLQHILVGLDGSPLAESILPYVTTLAQSLKAGITLITVTHLPEEVLDEEHRVDLVQLVERAEVLARDYLRGIEKRLEPSGITVKSAVAVGDAPTEIVRYAAHNGIDLIALATHGRSGIQRWVYGSVAEEVLHTAQTPLLLIRPGHDAAPVAATVSQVALPLDGSPLAEAALPYAEQLAAALKTPLVLLRAVEPVYVFGEPAVGMTLGYEDILSTLTKAAQDYVEPLAAELRSKGLSASAVTPIGVPAGMIAQHAQAHPGTLVVMATHGRTGLLGTVLGSVARRVVQQAGAPTLLVRPSKIE